jgi:hypothetical protein
VVYIFEAHTSDAWQMGINVREHVVFTNPKSFEEKGQIANTCVRKLGIEIPALVDDIQNTVETTYTGWPDRLYVIDKSGRVAYKSAPGPFGFEPRGVAETLKRLESAR